MPMQYLSLSFVARHKPVASKPQIQLQRANRIDWERPASIGVVLQRLDGLMRKLRPWRELQDAQKTSRPHLCYTCRCLEPQQYANPVCWLLAEFRRWRPYRLQRS